MSVLSRNQDQVIVGVDGSPPSLAALDWARRYAALRATTLEAVTAWPIPARDHRPAVTTPAEARALGHAALAASARPDDAPSKVWVSPVPEEPEDLLLHRSWRGQLLVLGPHSHHSVLEHLLGSTSEYLLTHAKCPVAIVHQAPEGSPRQRIVVGVDGSPAAQTALGWAVRHAELTDAKVTAMIAWEWQPEYGVYPYGPDQQHQHASAEATLARAVAALPDSSRQLVQVEVVRGDAADALVTAARDADLLVVGNNRPGRLAGQLLGSVGRKTASHATVPVVVTHEGAYPAGARG